jgi:hypothetical protein
MKVSKLWPMANIVIHCIWTTHGIGDLYNCYDGMPMFWDEHAMTCETSGLVKLFFPHIPFPLKCLPKFNTTFTTCVNLWLSEFSYSKCNRNMSRTFSKATMITTLCWVATCWCCGLGMLKCHASTWAIFEGVPNIDHTSKVVANNLRNWLFFMCIKVDFTFFALSMQLGVRKWASIL